MFASNINYQFHTYFSNKADPKAKAVDSFTVCWHSLKFYAFPLFSVISRTLKKIKAEKAEGILVVPYWPNQVWFPVLFKMLINLPVLITSRKNLLKLPQYPELVHLVWRKIDIVVCHLSSVHCRKQWNFKASSRHTGRIMATVDKEKICRTCAAIHTILSSMEC